MVRKITEYSSWILKNQGGLIKKIAPRPFKKYIQGKRFSIGAVITFLGAPAIIIVWLVSTINSATHPKTIKIEQTFSNERKVAAVVDNYMATAVEKQRLDLQLTAEWIPTPTLEATMEATIKPTIENLLPDGNNNSKYSIVNGLNIEGLVNNRMLGCVECRPYSVKLDVRSYNPILGGLNCWRFINGRCISETASGVKWQSVMNMAIACPYEWAFGTIVSNKYGYFICLDRGGMINCSGKNCIIDILTDDNINEDNVESTLWMIDP